MASSPKMRSNWAIRRRVMFAALIWLMGNVQYIILYGADSSLNQQTIIAMLGAITAIIGSYVFGAVWDDKNQRQVEAEYPSMTGSPYPDEMTEEVK